jgi:hypothetical protein
MVPQSWNESIETVANLLREHEAARKVADAAVAYWDVDDGTAEWDALAFNALETAVREYRALTEPPPLEARIEAAIEKAAPGWGE